jgi:hypothetical protein
LRWALYQSVYELHVFARLVCVYAISRSPVRILDTRGGPPVGGNSSITLQVTGVAGIPAGAKALICNATVTNTQGGGDLILWPDGVSRPNTSNLNYVGGPTVANFAIIGLSAAGVIDMFAHVNGTDVIIDAAGYVI